MNRSMASKNAKAKKTAMAEVLDRANMQTIADKKTRPASVDFQLYHKNYYKLYV